MSQCFSPLVRQNAVSQNVWDIMHILCLRTCLDYSRNKTDVLNCNVYSGHQIMTNEMGDVYMGFRLVNLKERNHLEDLCKYGLMKYVFS
jgi:hypothetical protein